MLSISLENERRGEERVRVLESCTIYKRNVH
jgi:hypothetical protein